MNKKLFQILFISFCVLSTEFVPAHSISKGGDIIIIGGGGKGYGKGGPTLIKKGKGKGDIIIIGGGGGGKKKVKKIIKVIPKFIPIPMKGKCGNEKWIQFRNEKCFLLMDKLMTQTEGQEMCRLETQNSSRGSRLVSIESPEEKEFIEKHLNELKVEDSLWLDLMRVEDSKDTFHNSYGEEPVYENWGTDRPTADTKKKCTQMRGPTQMSPSNAKMVPNNKWEDVVCFKKNLVICQKPIEWDQVSMQRTFLKTQRQLNSMKRILNDFRRKSDDTNKLKTFENSLNEMRDQLNIFEHHFNEIDNKTNIALREATISRYLLKEHILDPVPIGFVYIQLPGQPEPKTLWPSAKWTDISKNYQGLFFRVMGNGSAPFNRIQPQNSPHLIEVSSNSKDNLDSKINNEKTVLQTNNDWSGEVFAGSHQFEQGNDTAPCDKNNHFLRFKVSSGEVRPRNTAIIIWKRMA